MKFEALKPERIKPRHGVTHRALVDKLKDDMSENGWRERRLLVVKLNPAQDLQDYEGITGVHRLAAARELGIVVPALVLEQSDLPPGFSPSADHREYERMFRKAGLSEAADLMREEFESGYPKIEIKPTRKDRSGAARFRMKRVGSDDW